MICVDEIMDYGWRLGPSCHMFDDGGDLEALHAFASKIGLKRRWFQRGTLDHYDLTEGRRRVAVRLGAREVDRDVVVAAIRAHRARRAAVS